MNGFLHHLATLARRLGRLGTIATGGDPSNNRPFSREDVDDSNNAKTGKIAIGVIVGMFLFGFASIPLYRMICAETDPGGSSWYIGEPDVYEDVEVDEERTVDVRFSTNVNRQLPWSFDTDTSSVQVNPGEQEVVDFEAANLDTRPVTGKAVYDISPPEAAPHFKKTECFCFIEQTLDPDEEVDFPLVFWFDSDLPDHVEQIDLGYTFFNAESSRARAKTDDAPNR